MYDVALVIAAFVVDEDGGIVLVLNEPSLPQVMKAFLVARGADDSQCVQVDGLFNSVRGGRGLAVDDDGEAMKEKSVEEIACVLFILDAVKKKIRE